MLITFELSNMRFIQEVKKDSSVRILAFDAMVLHDTELVVDGEGKLRYGVARIYEDKAPSNEIGTFSYIPSYEIDGQAQLHCFQSTTHIPTDTFKYLLGLDPKTITISLTVEFDSFECNFKYGCVPGDHGIYWNPTVKPFEIIEATQVITVAIK